MQSIRTLLARKPRKLVMTDPECAVLKAMKKMAEHGVGALLVADRESNLLGIVTERDVSKGAAAFGEALLTRPVKDLMTEQLISCDVSDGLADALAMMKGGRIRHLPVTDGREVVGLLSIRDMLAVCMEAVRGDDAHLRKALLSAAWSDEPAPETWLTVSDPDPAQGASRPSSK